MHLYQLSETQGVVEGCLIVTSAFQFNQGVKLIVFIRKYLWAAFVAR